MLHKIVSRDPRDPCLVNPGVPRDLGVICLKAMEKKRDARYEKLKSQFTGIEAWKVKFSEWVTGTMLKGTKQERRAIIKDIQVDPITREFTHIDFIRVTRGHKLTVTMPIELVGDSVGMVVEISALEAMSGIDRMILSGTKFEDVSEDVVGHLVELTRCQSASVIARDADAPSKGKMISSCGEGFMHERIDLPVDSRGEIFPGDKSTLRFRPQTVRMLEFAVKGAEDGLNHPVEVAPNMMPNPTAQKTIEPTEKSMRFFIRMLMAFLARVKPTSTMAKPACMKKTNAAATRVHT